MGNSEVKVFITNLDKRQIKNDNTGEVRDYCMVTYFINKESTDKSKGCAMLSCYCSPTAFKDLDSLLMKWSDAKLTQTVDKNRIKLKLKSVNGVLVS